MEKKIKLLGHEWNEDVIKEIAQEELLKITPSLSDEEEKTKLNDMVDHMTKMMKEIEKAEDLLNFLEIPSFGGKVNASQLVDILMDETKLQQIVSKLKNRMFW